MRSPILAASLLAVLLSLSTWTRADDLKDVYDLAEEGQYTQALDRLNGYLSAHPGDVSGQFLKGVILAEQGKANDAIKLFSDITTKHPELPEPYNNLAVLYADQGQYDKAQRALESAIKTHPSYATAHENLGDVYAKMASDAYDKALQLDKNNSRTQTKLAMVKELFSGTAHPAAKPAVVAAASATTAAPLPTRTTAAPASARPASAAPAVALPGAASAPVKATQTVVPPSDAKNTTGNNATKAVVAVADKPASADKPVGDETPRGVEETVRGWAKAWSSQDVEAYLSYYGSGFDVPGGGSRSAWEKSRRERITAPSSIRVELNNIKVSMDGDSHAKVSFNQHYRANGVSKRTGKTLDLKRSGGKWTIQQELANR